MSVGSEELIDLLNILWFVIFNPATWLAVAGLALKKVRHWYQVLFGTLAHFCSMVGISAYNGADINEILFDFEWLVLVVPTSIAGGTIVVLMVFYLFKLRTKIEKNDVPET